MLTMYSGVYFFNPMDLQTHGWVEDPRILWPDSASIGFDGYFYVTVTHLFDQPDWNFGVDSRIKPGAILRMKLPNNGTKITTLG